MAVGVPCIWTLHEDAKSLPTDTADDLVAMARIQSLLPQGENKLLWYAFTDEAMLVKAGLVYDKEFHPKAPDDPPSWATDLYLIFSFHDRPSLFPRVAITTKTKPLPSMIPESTSAPPQVTGSTPPPTIPLAKIPSILK
ncbi:hypothetical protein LIER_27915 [Lithospermum erythrorhizon]|uniref:Uncharacterized protein n=1 Tax=Lithospermum erythrorhizon TaxID=34254 RepID=A0AAV3RDS6_LITER